MEYKVLEQNGVENENIDGAAFNNFSAGGRSGILKGILSECAVYSPSSNSVGVSSGELLIHGFRVKITSPFEHSFPDSPESELEYQIVAGVTVLSNRDIQFSISVREVQSLISDNVYDTEVGSYEVEIARFLYSLNGVRNLQRTLTVIEGGGISQSDLQEIILIIDQKENKKTIVNTVNTTVLLQNYTEYNLGSRENIVLQLPEELGSSFECIVNFYSGEVATTFDAPESIVFTQDDCLDGALYPMPSRLYEINIKSVSGVLVARVGAVDYEIL